jgi:glycosyltransferase involved in cell wall biosynthesis
MKKVSIIIPCHNEQDNIQKIYSALTDIFKICPAYEFEILMIDDGSIDNTLYEIKKISEKDKQVFYISLSRNFGKENAMLAGFDNVSGDCTIIMDADMQHPPTLIPDMLKLWEEGYDDVYAERINRGKESILRKKLSLLYYKILNRLAKTDVLPNVGDFRLLDRKCIESLKLIRETQRYTKGLYCWIGFKKKKIMFNQNDRVSGTSSFNFRKLLDLAIEGIISYTTAPLKFSTILGMLVSLAAFIYMCYVLTKTILYGDPVQGFPTLIIVILFLGGIQLISLGIIGEYLSRIFYETKNRPIYIVKEKNI